MPEVPRTCLLSLRVSGLCKSYGGRPALENVTFSMRGGEVLATDSTSHFKDFVVTTRPQ